MRSTTPAVAGLLLLASTLPVAAQGSVARPRRAIELEPIATYATGIFDESAAESIAAQWPAGRLYVTNSDARAIDVLSFFPQSEGDPIELTKSFSVALPGDVQSVSFGFGRFAVAVAADPETDPGSVLLFDPQGNQLAELPAGALPDQLTFTPSGKKILVANEGEPDGDVDPPGGITVIDLSDGIVGAVVTQLDFTAYDARRADLVNRGVRIFPGKMPSTDFEPEYIAVAEDGLTAWAVLQEANAVAVIDLDGPPAIVAIVPLGTKDHERGAARLNNYEFTDVPVLGTTAGGQEIALGGLSGLWFEGMEGDIYRFATVPDRGPNGEPTDVDGDGANERPFALPEYQAQVVRFELDTSNGVITITEQLPLWRSDATTPITGLPNIPGADEEPVDLLGNLLPYDEFGADMEGIIVTADGSIWTVDEYRPAIYHFDAMGVLIDRFVPEGTAALAGAPVGTYGTESLPGELIERRRNRGFEAMALDPVDGILYAFIQTPLSNPDRAAGDASKVIRMVGIDPATGATVAEYVYLLEDPSFRTGNVDKIGDAVWYENDEFLIMERDSAVSRDAKKMIFRASIKGATNLAAPGAPALVQGMTLEQHTPDQLAALGIEVVRKIKVANLPSIGYLAGDKPEGLALLPGGQLAVLNDNDFGLLDAPLPIDGTVPLSPNPTPIVLGVLDFAGNTLDPSNRDDAIALANWPVNGMLMPDAIAGFEIDGANFWATVNEGDARDEGVRGGDLDLDPVEFPDASTLQMDENLGRISISSIDGDLDGDGDLDELFVYGGRSFTIFDAFGNVVFDSGDEIARVIAAADPEDFNSTNDENESFDNRSDDKGSEPEALAVGRFRGRTYAFIGLERHGGLVVYEVTDPYNASFVQYLSTRDFFGDAEAGTAGDLGPETIAYTQRSFLGMPLLAVANEVSGTTTLYAVRPGRDIPTLPAN